MTIQDMSAQRVNNTDVINFYQRQCMAKELAALNLRAFCDIFLSRHFYIQPYSEVHEILFDKLKPHTANQRLVIKAPRGSGKSTLIGLGYALWQLAYKRKRFIVYIKENDDKAKSSIKLIQQEIETNNLLKMHFPQLQPKRGEYRKSFVKYSDHLIYMDNGSIVMAVGKGSALRGINEIGLRPDAIIFDDPQGKKEKESVREREKDMANFNTEIRYLAGPGRSLDIILIGTLIAHDCLIEEVSQKQGWESISVDAVNDEDQTTYWPAVYCHHIDDLTEYERQHWSKRGQDGIDLIREPFYGTLYDEKGSANIIGLHDENPDAFDQEFRQIPIERSAMPFRRDLWRDYVLTTDLLKKMKRRVGVLDLSMGKKSSDWQAVAVMGMIDQDYYLIDGILCRIDLVGGTAGDTGLAGLCISFIKHYRLSLFAVEDNGAQGLFMITLKRLCIEQDIRVQLRTFTSKVNKEERIRNGFGIVMQRGNFRIRQDWEKAYPEFMRQIEQFPLIAHDDAPDVTDMAITAINRMR